MKNKCGEIVTIYLSLIGILILIADVFIINLEYLITTIIAIVFIVLITKLSHIIKHQKNMKENK
jgi:hypothetical protein